MRPPMTDIVSILTPTGEVDRFGRNITTEQISSARVAPLIRTIETPDGNKVDTTAEIDLPPEIVVGYGTRIKFFDQFKQWKESTVLSLDYSPDLANRVLFWTVRVG